MVTSACTAFRHAATEETLGNLRRTRLEITSALATLEPGALPNSWNLFSGAHAALRLSGIRDLARTPDEEALLQRLVARFTNGPAQPIAPGILLAAMLLARNFELPLIREIGMLPDWLRQIYFMELLVSPSVFNEAGEAERYADYLERFTDLVHQLWVRTPGAQHDPAIVQLASLYALHANLVQAYFSPRNLRSLYRQRGEIISKFIVSRGVTTLSGFAPQGAGGAGKIKLGIFAQHFMPQTETYFTLSHFEHLDRERFDVTLYAVRSGNHPLEQYCVSRADRLVVLHPTELAEQARQIRNDQLDILLISTNMTAITNTATLLGGMRMARIQIASVSSPVTTGARHVDVLLSAAWNESAADAADHYTERLHLLPGAINYYAYQHDRDPATVEVSRGKLGIPADAVVFFSGANYFKILPELSNTWARILAAVPGSVLLLMPFNANWSSSYQRLPFVTRIRRQLGNHGVAVERLRIIEPVPARADVHRVVALADVYLDAYPFAGACSMLDSILAHVPAVVRRGRVGRSNFGAASLQMVGLQELCCDSEQEYVAKSIALAGDRSERLRLRERLQGLGAMPLPPYYDTALFSSRVGAAFETLHHGYHDRYARLAADGSALRGSLRSTAARVVGNMELNALTDLGIVRLLIEPYFRGQPTARPRLMLDVGACHGDMAAPLLACGWHAELFEPDPAARRVLEQKLAAHQQQIRVHALAAGSRTAARVDFHQAQIQGLSGLGASPLGATASVLSVPCVTLQDFCAERAIERVDLLKIDAEGYDFDVLESLDFQRVKPQLVLIEYGTHFPRQTLHTVNRVMEDMSARGFGALVFAYTDDGNFKHARWIYRLTRLLVDSPLAADEDAVFGNILFYPSGDARLLITLQMLLDSCDAPRTAA